uniref:Uncharacterized protein n=1 Tax=Tanacetum cinerariifolium TaxID=118510 RepID=A0A6L2M101_TANCI|nr:hypothetical protein [Tanacetum cinerariifolium]
MRIPLLYRGEYSQWHEKFMNYLEEQTDGETMINSIQNDDHPLPVVAQVSLVGTASNAIPTLKDPKFWTAEEKKTRKIDRLARSLLIEGLSNDIYSLIDSNETAKDLWDALERQMRGSEYGEQYRKAAILYEYETFKATEGENFLDTYLRCLQVINDLKKCGYKKDNCELNYKFLNNLQPEWKQYGTLMRQSKNLMDINIDALYNILKRNQGDVNDALGYKKKVVVVALDPFALVAEKQNDLKKITALLAKAFNRKKYCAKPTNNNLRTSSASFSSTNKKSEYVKSVKKKENKKKAKVKDYNYYKTKMLAKKESDEQVLLAENQAWMESSSDSDQEINANMVFMAKMENVLSYSDESSSSAEETIAEEERYEYMIRYSTLCDNDKQHRKKIDEKEILFDKMSRQLVEMNNNVLRLQEKILEKESKISELEGCTIHMIMPSKDTLYNGRKGIALEIEKFKRERDNKIEFAYDYGNLNASYVNEKIIFLDDYFQEIINPDFEKIDSLFQQTSSLKSYVPTVILEKIIIDLEEEVVSLLEKKANLETIKSLKSKCFESSENAISKSENQSENDCQVVEKECDKVENSKVIAPRMFKLNVSQSVSPISINDFAMIAGYGDVVIGSTTINKSTCFIRNKDGIDLLTGDRSSNLYTIAFNKVASNSSTCLLAKVSSSQSWLWHQRLSHLNFTTINNLVKNNLVQGLPKMKFDKDHLCSACEQGKIHRKHHKKRYVLVVVDDYSRYTWVFFIHSKDEASEVIISFIKKTQVNLQLQVQRVRTNNGTEFKNKTLAKFFDELSQHLVSHKIIRLSTNVSIKLLIHKRFGFRCYLLNDYDDVRKLKAKGDIEVFVGYSKESAAFRIYNKRTRKIHESVNVNFNEILEMASKQFSFDPGLSILNETENFQIHRFHKFQKHQKKIWKIYFKNFTMSILILQKIMKSSTTNVETSNVEIPSHEEEVFHESFESFQEESSSSLLNDDVQQSSKEVEVPSSNTQSVSNNMVPNVNEASTSYNVFNERLEDAYFNASTSFHDSSNVHTFYQPYPHEKKWTKDHPLHYHCSIEPANVDEALKDVDWVSAMQEELDQFARFKVLLNVFTETLYTGNPWVYLIHNHGTKHKVWLKNVYGTNNYALYSCEWKAFITHSQYVRVNTLHFIRATPDEYYVTGYHNDGTECNGYDLARVGFRQRSPIDKDPRMQHECVWDNHEEHHQDEKNCFYALLLAYVTD